MLMSQKRFATGVTWFLAGLATLVWLPRLLGTEQADQKRLDQKRPSVVFIDVTELPREQDSQTPAAQTPPALQPKLPTSHPLKYSGEGFRQVKNQFA